MTDCCTVCCFQLGDGDSDDDLPRTAADCAKKVNSLGLGSGVDVGAQDTPTLTFFAIYNKEEMQPTCVIFLNVGGGSFNCTVNVVNNQFNRLRERNEIDLKYKVVTAAQHPSFFAFSDFWTADNLSLQNVRTRASCLATLLIVFFSLLSDGVPAQPDHCERC